MRIYIYRGNKFRAKGSQARPGSSCCSRAMGHAVLGPERGGRKKSGRKARMARFPRRAAAILLRPANQEAGNAETTLRATEAPPPQRSTLDHGSIACRNHPFDAPGKASPSSRGEAEKGSKRARARVHPRTTTFSVSLKTASFCSFRIDYPSHRDFRIPITNFRISRYFFFLFRSIADLSYQMILEFQHFRIFVSQERGIWR